MNYQHEPHGVFFLIDNKSFYASCEAVQRGFNPLKVPLVVLSEAKNTNGGLILATNACSNSLITIIMIVAWSNGRASIYRIIRPLSINRRPSLSGRFALNRNNLYRLSPVD
jgi:hypothetical protein